LRIVWLGFLFVVIAIPEAIRLEIDVGRVFQLMSSANRANPAAYLPDFSLISAMSPFTTTVVPNGRDKSANRSNM